MADPKPVLRGENVPVVVFVDRVPQRASDVIKSLKITESATQHRDKYLGQRRDRPDKQVDGFDASVELDVSDSVLMDSLIAQNTAREANQPIPEITLKFDLENRDGAVQSYFLSRLTSKFELNVGGKNESVTMSLELQAEDLIKAA